MKCGAATRLTGRPCSRDVAPGFTRCYLHGGASPGAKLQAEQALAFARLPAIEALHQIIHDWGAEVCDVCGRPNFENAHPVIRAAQIILDRTGFGPKATLEVSRPGASDLDVERLTAGERDRLAGLLGQLAELKAEVRARLELEAAAPTVDVEVLPIARQLSGLSPDSETTPNS